MKDYHPPWQLTWQTVSPATTINGRGICQLCPNGALAQRQVGYSVETTSHSWTEDFSSCRNSGWVTENLSLLTLCPTSQGTMELHLLHDKGSSTKSAMSPDIWGFTEADGAWGTVGELKYKPELSSYLLTWEKQHSLAGLEGWCPGVNSCPRLCFDSHDLTLKFVFQRKFSFHVCFIGHRFGNHPFCLSMYISFSPRCFSLKISSLFCRNVNLSSWRSTAVQKAPFLPQDHIM